MVTECYLPALSRLGRLDDVLVVDRSRGARERIQATFGRVRVEVTDYGTALANAGGTDAFDAAVIALPNELHEEAVLRSFAAGLHVLCEKPLAMSAAACRRLEIAARESGLVLRVGMVRRYFPSVAAVTNALDAGLIGSLRTVRIADGHPFNWPSDSGAYFRRENGGVLINMGIHYLDLLERWVGPLRPREYRDDCEGGVEANCLFRLESRNGSAGVTVRLSYTHDLDNTIQIVGTAGEISLDVGEVRTCQWHRHNPDVRGPLSVPESESIIDVVDAFGQEIAEFSEAIRRRKSPQVSGDEASRTAALIDWAYENRQPLLPTPEPAVPSRPTLGRGKTVVTGGSGFVGTRLVHRLRGLGFSQSEVVVPVRSYRSGAAVGSLPIQRTPMNLLDYESVLECIRGARHVFHLAYGTGPNAHRITVEGTRNVVEASIETGAEAVVIASTTTVFGFDRPQDGRLIDETSPYRPALGEYGRSKAEMERACLKRARSSARTRVVVLDPVVVYGPGCRMYVELPCRSARAGQFCWIDNGRGKINYTYVDNLVDALILAATSEKAHGQRFIISDGVCSFREFLTPLLGSAAERLPSYTRDELEAMNQRQRASLRELLHAMMNDRAVALARRIPMFATAARLIPAPLKARYRSSRRRFSDPQQERYTSARLTPPPVSLCGLYGPFAAEYSAEGARRILQWRPHVSLSEGLRLCQEWLAFLGLSAGAADGEPERLVVE